jgi:hypothetical protein
VRRLTAAEYVNTVRDLLGVRVRSDLLAGDEPVAGFFSNSSAPASAVAVSQYATAAQEIAAAVPARSTAFLGCDPVTGEDACARRFVRSFASRAYRRPVTAPEQTALFGIYSEIKQAAGFEVGIRMVIEAVLQSPKFLYRIETGADVAGPGVVKLTGHELASRLSYLFWSTTPDEPLLAAAAAGQLATPEGIAAQVRRMTGDRRFTDTLTSFHTQWLKLTNYGGLEKDPKVYPEFTAALRAAARTETLRFAETIVRDPQGRWDDLLTATWSFVNAPLGRLYGVAASGDALARADMPAAERSGLLTHVSVLSANADENQSSPILRGLFVREQLLCHEIAPPPAEVEASPPPPKEGKTTRVRFQEHRENPACGGCHDLIDPIGFGFESYDGIGRHRTREGGLTIDASGQLAMPGGAVTGFVGAVDLGRHLAQNAEVRLCMTTQWLRFALGRAETASDACSIQHIEQAFAHNGRRMSDLLVALATSETFRHARVR